MIPERDHCEFVKETTVKDLVPEVVLTSVPGLRPAAEACVMPNCLDETINNRRNPHNTDFSKQLSESLDQEADQLCFGTVDQQVDRICFGTVHQEVDQLCFGTVDQQVDRICFGTVDQEADQICFGTVDQEVDRFCFGTVDQEVDRICFGTVDQQVDQLCFGTVDQQVDRICFGTVHQEADQICFGTVDQEVDRICFGTVDQEADQLCFGTVDQEADQICFGTVDQEADQFCFGTVDQEVDRICFGTVDQEVVRICFGTVDQEVDQFSSSWETAGTKEVDQEVDRFCFGTVDQEVDWICFGTVDQKVDRICFGTVDQEVERICFGTFGSLHIASANSGPEVAFLCQSRPRAAESREAEHVILGVVVSLVGSEYSTASPVSLWRRRSSPVRWCSGPLQWLRGLLCRMTLTQFPLLAELDSQEVSDAVGSSGPYPMFLPVSYQVQDADYFLLKEAGQDIMRNSSMQSHTQPFVILRAERPPVVNASYGPLSTEQEVPLDLVQSVQLFRPSPPVFTFNWKVRSFVLTRSVFSSSPKVRVLFYVAGRDWDRGLKEKGTKDELPCVTVYAFWQTQEVRGSCLISNDRGTCMAEVEPPEGWFSPNDGTGTGSSSREKQGLAPGNPLELYYQAQPSSSGRCSGGPEGGKRGRTAGGGTQPEYVPMTPMQRIGSVRLLQVRPGAQPVSVLRLGEAVVIQTSSKPLRKTDIASFYVYMKSSANLDTFSLRWTVRDDSSSAAAQCSVGHPLVLHQWAQDPVPKDAAQRTRPRGRCPQDAAPQDAAPQDAAHRTLPTGCSPKDATPQDTVGWMTDVSSTTTTPVSLQS
ncbi:hypothetical protein NFI96_008165 [Prochilodus magdalenae]|nr:hypothetical protein NFI96_008165 [Prochilodus magdalenae]